MAKKMSKQERQARRARKRAKMSDDEVLNEEICALTADPDDVCDEVDDNDPIFTLPPFKVESVFTTMAETIDWGIEITGIPGLWRQSRGEGIKVGVLDTGIALNHPDLRDAIQDAKDFTGSRSGPGDVQGHGTHVAGTIAARENSSGVIGAAPKAKLIVGKVLGDNGSGSSASVAAGIRWAVDQGADLLSMSLGSSVSSRAILDAVKYAISKNVFVIAAAGNEGPQMGTVGYPGKYRQDAPVGAIDRRKKVTSFSSRGPEVTICAPGDNILSTYPPRELAKLSGTSMATPLVSGVVALMLAKHKKNGGRSPIKTQDDLINHLRKTAIDLGPAGYDPHYGAGLINPKQVIAVANDGGGGGEQSALATINLLRSDLTESGRAKLDEFLKQVGDADGVDIRIALK